MYGLSTAVCGLLAVCNVLEEMGFAVVGPVTIFCDSQGAHSLVADCAGPARTRHIHRNDAFVRELERQKEIVIEYIKSEANLADFFTKIQPVATFRTQRDEIMHI